MSASAQKGKTPGFDGIKQYIIHRYRSNLKKPSLNQFTNSEQKCANKYIINYIYCMSSYITKNNLVSNKLNKLKRSTQDSMAHLTRQRKKSRCVYSLGQSIWYDKPQVWRISNGIEKKLEDRNQSVKFNTELSMVRTVEFVLYKNNLNVKISGKYTLTVLQTIPP